MTSIIERLHRGVIVSCQAESGDPFDRPDRLAAFAEAAAKGGAVGIRAQGSENIKAIREAVTLPIIGIIKGKYADGWVLITPDHCDVESILKAGADVVALDATERRRPNGRTGPEFLADVRSQFGSPIMADIATIEDGIAAAEAGADLVATTLSGYTAESEDRVSDGPDLDLISDLAMEITVPIIAEGRIWAPEDAHDALRRGAYAVVVGTAITRPRVITARFVEALKVPE